MTTTVYDGVRKMITCDSRWSLPDERFGVLYVDEAPFQKLEIVRDHAFVFAGKAVVINAWKIYLQARASGRALDLPTMDGIAVLVAFLQTGALKHYYGQDIILPDVFDPQTIFAGTGSTPAARCWEINRCPHRAVMSAMDFDVSTGGEVKFVELSSGQHNLTLCQGLNSLEKAFMEKGMVMFNRNDVSKMPIPFKEAAAMDPAVASLFTDAEAGILGQRVQAPCDAMFKKPTQDDVNRMSMVLDDIFA
jgi:hypothetical protein